MGLQTRKTRLVLTEEERHSLHRISQARVEEYRRVERARMIMHYADGLSLSQIAEQMGVPIAKVKRCIDKAYEVGVLQALDEDRRPGRPKEATPEAKNWLMSLVCRKPEEFGYDNGRWTLRLLANHIRQHAHEEGHECLSRVSPSSVSRLLAELKFQPHKTRLFVEQRKNERVAAKQARYLHVYHNLAFIKHSDGQLSLAGAKGAGHGGARRGECMLQAAINLDSGEVVSMISQAGDQQAFLDFLAKLDHSAKRGQQLQLVLDGHESHTSSAASAYLQSMPGRFEFVFAPLEGSWLRIIEVFFLNMAMEVVRNIQEWSGDELIRSLELRLREATRKPVAISG